MSEFDRIRDAIEEAERNLSEVYDLDVLAVELRDLRGISKLLRLIDDDISERIVPQISGRLSVEIEGVGVIQAKKGAERKGWDHEGLVRLVVALGRDERKIDLETGEALESEADAVVRALVECAGIRDWRTTKLRSRGIDPDEFCSVSYGPAKVIGL